MQSPVEVRFHNLTPSPAVEQAVRERAGKLDKFSQDILSCRVTVEGAHKHHHKGNLFSVRVDVRFPGGEVVASRGSAEDHAHEDVYVAVRDAFDAVRRQLEDRVRVRRGDVKPHAEAPHGTIALIDAPRRCGRIATPDGREIYFHANSVVDADFDRLEPGATVRFTEEAGDEGPQASTVHVLRTPHNSR